MTIEAVTTPETTRSPEQLARDEMVGDLVKLAYRMHTRRPGSLGQRLAVRKFRRKLRVAMVRMQFAERPEMVQAVRAQLDALYRCVHGTSETAVAKIQVWPRPQRPLDSVQVTRSRKRVTRRVRSDQEVLDQYGEQLLNELRESGTLSRYRVEKVCQVTHRQAERVRTSVRAKLLLQDSEQLV
ncbi:hypothetical protein [Kribbella deserti]|uniref:CHAD domain-containing protein n=1 Tax=Kribbella deserti TaxID=1926257 RepID=A0ABV6QKB2_9ACTN